MKNWLKKNWFKAGTLTAILVAAVATAYYYAIFLPNTERLRTNQQKIQQNIDLGQREIGPDERGSSSILAQQKNTEAINPAGASTQTKASAPVDLATLVKEWRPRVALIICKYPHLTEDGNTYFKFESGGSGTLVKFGYGQVVAMTNSHVISATTKLGEEKFPSSCIVQFPDHDVMYESSWKAIQRNLDGLDQGFVAIENPDQYITQLASKSFGACFEKADLGDQVIILGYPDIGASSDITVTEGIVSGYDDEYYVTSAKVEAGNSGGVAVLVKDNCYLGIPTYAKIGDVESLARILKVNYIFTTDPTKSEYVR